MQQIKYLDPVAVSKLKNIEIKARLIVEGFITGLHKSPYHGFSVEFAEHRPYNTGEPLRNVDWKVFGKSEKLYTKKFEEETNLRCHILMDISDSMRYPIENNRLSKLEYSSYLTAALAYLMIQQRDAVGLTLFDEQVQFHTPAKAKKTWLIPMFVKLEEIIAQKNYFTRKTATAKVLHEIAQKIGRRGLIVIVSDLFNNLHATEELFPALQHLRHGKHEVVIFHILDKKTEEQFDFPNMPILLKDLETGEEIRVQPEQMRTQYQTLLKNYKELVKRKCREINVDFIEVDIEKPYDKVLTEYMIRRDRLIKK